MEEAIKLGVATLKQVMEEKLNSGNIQLATVTLAGGFQILTKEQVEVVIESLTA